MDSPSAPQTPDPVATANAQAGANIQSAQATTALNRANQYTPYGSLTWEQGAPVRTFNQGRYDSAVAAAQKMGDPTYGLSANGDYTMIPGQPMGSTPDRNADQFYDMNPSQQWSSHITLDPRVQAMLDAQMGTAGKVQGQVDSMFSQPAPQASEALRKQVEDATYGRYTSRLDPEYAQSEEAMKSSLMNRGITEGSDAWKNVTDSFGRAKNDAYDQARQDAVLQGGNEEQRQLSMEEGSRTALLNQLSALTTGSQAQIPNFAATPSGAAVNPAPIGQSIWNSYQGNMNQYGADVASNNGNTAAAGSALAAIAAAYI